MECELFHAMPINAASINGASATAILSHGDI
jgi:hypothetical protein